MAGSLPGTSVSPADLGITKRQMKVLALLMQGKSNKAICRALDLAEPTVKSHVTSIMKALRVTNRTEAVLAVSALGWDLRRSRQSLCLGETATDAKTTGSRPPGAEHDAPRRTSDAARRATRVRPDKPSIVVLPFTNLSGDPAQDYFADGMVGEITIALSRIPRLFVIATSSAFAYRGHTVDMKQIGAELGVRYILDGSIRKDANQVRILVQLSDASLGRQIWGERFEGDLEKIFELQDRVAASNSAIIAPMLLSLEAEHARRKPTGNPSPYDLYLRALPPHRDTFAQNQESLRLLYKAIELDPSFAAAYGLAAYCHHMQWVFAWQTLPDDCFSEGVRLARLAAEMGDDDPEALWTAGRTLAALAGECERGLALIERSISLNPNSARAWWVSGMTHAHLGHAQTALNHFERAQRLNPRDASEHGHWNGIALAHLFCGNFGRAKEAIDRALIDWPSSPAALRTKAAICGQLGKIDEGRACVRRLLTLNPDTTVATVTALNHLQMRPNPVGLKNFLDGLRRSGLSEA